MRWRSPPAAPAWWPRGASGSRSIGCPSWSCWPRPHQRAGGGGVLDRWAALRDRGGGEGASYLYDTATPQVERTWTPHVGGSVALAFSPQGALLATGGADGRLHVEAVGTGKVIAAWELSGAAGGALAFHPGGALASSAGTHVEVRDLASRRVTGRIHGHGGGVAALAFTPDGRHMLSAGEGERGLAVWSLFVAEGTSVRSLVLDEPEGQRSPSEVLAAAEAVSGLEVRGLELVPRAGSKLR